MKGRHKKFEKDVYDQCDGPAKDAVSSHLRKIGHVVTVPPEDYGPDLYSVWHRRKIYHEVEVSLGWEAEKPFPFFKASIPERKRRLLTKIGGCDLFFWMLRSDCGRAMVMPAAHMYDRYLVEVPNRKIAIGEYFYRIPTNLGKEFDLCP